MMQAEEREQRKDEQPEVAEIVEQTAAEADSDDRTKFSSAGPLPAVEADEDVTRKPSASELAYGDDTTKAPPKKSDAKATDKAKANETKPTQKAPVPQVLKDFCAKFKAAGDLILASPKAMELVNEAAAAGVKFGGYSEDGPVKDTWPYTAGDSVYVPKAHTDPLTAMADFLFELNNAIRAPKFAVLHAEADKGSKGSLTAKSYARKKVELEVEGMLRLGEVWFETKKSAGKQTDKTWGSHDDEFYLEEYEAYKSGKKTKDQIVDEVLKWTYSQGNEAGKTTEQFYMEQYNAKNGSK